MTLITGERSPVASIRYELLDFVLMLIVLLSLNIFCE